VTFIPTLYDILEFLSFSPFENTILPRGQEGSKILKTKFAIRHEAIQILFRMSKSYFHREKIRTRYRAVQSYHRYGDFYPLHDVLESLFLFADAILKLHREKHFFTFGAFTICLAFLHLFHVNNITLNKILFCFTAFKSYCLAEKIFHCLEQYFSMK